MIFLTDWRYFLHRVINFIVTIDLQLWHYSYYLYVYVPPSHDPANFVLNILPHLILVCKKIGQTGLKMLNNFNMSLFASNIKFKKSKAYLHIWPKVWQFISSDIINFCNKSAAFLEFKINNCSPVIIKYFNGISPRFQSYKLLPSWISSDPEYVKRIRRNRIN